MRDLTCSDCGSLIDYPGTGRPATRCVDCRASRIQHQNAAYCSRPEYRDRRNREARDRYASDDSFRQETLERTRAYLSTPDGRARRKNRKLKWQGENRETYLAGCRRRNARKAMDPEWVEANRRTVREWREADPERAKNSRHRSTLKRRYGLTPERYDELLAEQGGGCAICGRPPITRRLHVDHDHACCSSRATCGRCVRGLLCSPCNWHLGWLENRSDSISAYLAAADRQEVAA